MIEYPDITVLPDGPVQVSLVIMQTRATIHNLSNFMVIRITVDTKENYDIEKYASQLESSGAIKLLGVFIDNEEAEAFMHYKVDEATLEYTTVINKLPDLSEVRNRKFIAFLGEEISVIPGCYEVRKGDYLKLESQYPQIRLATDEELSNIEMVYRCFIPQDFDLVRNLELPYLQGVRVISSADVIECLDKKMMLEAITRLAYLKESLAFMITELESEGCLFKIENAIKIVEEISPESDAKDVVDRLLKQKKDINNGVESEPVTFPVRCSIRNGGDTDITVQLETC